MKIVRWIMLLAGLGAAGCSIGPAPTPNVAIYDFGVDVPKAQTARIRASLALDDVNAPAWLQSPAILYRLAYQDIAQLQPYSRARWAAAPPALVTERLRQGLGAATQHGLTPASAGVHSDFLLRTELDSFAQVVDSPSAARAIVRIRASLIDTAKRRLQAQRVFEVEQPSPSVDAPGAVRALSAATDALIVQLIDWTARETTAQR